MSILALITGLLKLAGLIAGYAKDRQLISAGVAEAVAAGNAATLSSIDKARSAKDAMANNSDPAFSQRVRDKFSTDE